MFFIIFVFFCVFLFDCLTTRKNEAFFLFLLFFLFFLFSLFFLSLSPLFFSGKTRDFQLGGTNFTQTFTKEQYNDFFSYFGHQFSQQGTKNNGKSITYVCALVEGHKKQARERRKENKKSHQKNPNFICNGRLKIFINDKEQKKVTSVPHPCGHITFSRYPPIIVKYMQNHLSGLGIVALQQPGATRRTLKKMVVTSFLSSLLLSFSLVLFPLHFRLFSPLLLSFSLVSPFLFLFLFPFHLHFRLFFASPLPFFTGGEKL